MKKTQFFYLLTAFAFFLFSCKKEIVKETSVVKQQNGGMTRANYYTPPLGKNPMLDINNSPAEFDNINALRAIFDNSTYAQYANSTGYYVYLKGYNNPGDNGRGYFMWSPQGSTPDDSGLVIIPNTNTGGRLIRYSDPYITYVDYYGADIPNSDTSNAMLQKAKEGFERAVRMKNNLYLSDKHYHTDTLRFAAKNGVEMVTLYGGPNCRIYIHNIKEIGPKPDGNRYLTYGIKSYVGLDMSLIYILPHKTTHEYSYSQLFNNTNYQQFNFQYHQDFGGIYIAGVKCSLKNVRVFRSWIGMSFSNIASNKSLVVTDSCYSEGRYISATAYLCNNVLVEKSRFLGGGHGGFELSGSKVCTIRQCKVINPGSTGINPGGNSGYNAENFTINNNYVIAGDGINCENGINGADIQFNTVFVAPSAIGSQGVGIGFENHNNSEPVKNILIKNNTISTYNAGFGKFNSGIQGGKILDNDSMPEFSNIVIDGNIINDYPSYGIKIIGVINQNQIYGTHDISIINNTISGKLYGLVINNVKNNQQPNQYNKVQNNTISGFSTAKVFHLGNVEKLSICDNAVTSFSHCFYASTGLNDIYYHNFPSNTPNAVLVSTNANPNSMLYFPQYSANCVQ